MEVSEYEETANPQRQAQAGVKARHYAPSKR